jgi:hypothetical protein
MLVPTGSFPAARTQLPLPTARVMVQTVVLPDVTVTFPVGVPAYWPEALTLSRSDPSRP